MRPTRPESWPEKGSDRPLRIEKGWDMLGRESHTLWTQLSARKMKKEVFIGTPTLGFQIRGAGRGGRCLKGVVRSKFSRGYVGETLILTDQNRTKICRELESPIQLTQRMNLVRLWLTWKAKQSSFDSDIGQQSTYLICQGETCRPIGSRRFHWRKPKM